jgi:hypothetical protein
MKSLLLPLAFLLPTLVACTGDPIDINFDFDPGGRSSGQLTDTEYSWRDATTCLFGCALDTPLISGSAGTITLAAPSGANAFVLDSIEVESAGIVEVVAVDSYDTLTLRGLGVGTTDLRLLDVEGTVVDIIEVSVAEVATLAIRPNFTEEEITVGYETPIFVEFWDDRERVLVGDEPLSWSIVEGNERALLSSASPRNQDPITTNLVNVEAIAAGPLKVRAETSTGQSIDIDIAIQ